MDNSTHTELLIRYLDNELTDAEKQQLQQQLQEDAAMQKELEGLQIAKQAVKSYALKNEIGNIHQQMMKEMKQETPVRKINSSRRILRYAIAVAASVLLIFGGLKIFNFYQLSSDKLFAEQYLHFESGTTRGASNTETSAIETAYNNKNYAEVVSLKKKASELTAADQFFAGLSYIELNDAPNAISSFKAAININKSAATEIYKNEIDYYLALAYLKNKDYDQAIDLMNAIKDDTNNVYHERFTDDFISKVQMLKWR